MSKKSFADGLKDIRDSVKRNNAPQMHLRTFGNNLPSLKHLQADGEDHINVDSRASTELGMLLSETSMISLNHPTYGPFSTLIGFWHWFRDPSNNDQYRHLRSREVIELTRNNQTGRNIVPNLVYHVVVANHHRIVNNEKLYNLVLQSKLPFDMYYYTTTRDSTIPIRKECALWFVAGLEETRYAIQNNTEPNFSGFLDNPEEPVVEYNIVKNYKGAAYLNTPKPVKKQPKVQNNFKPAFEGNPNDGSFKDEDASTEPKKPVRTPEEHAIWKANKLARKLAKRETEGLNVTSDYAPDSLSFVNENTNGKSILSTKYLDGSEPPKENFNLTESPCNITKEQIGLTVQTGDQLNVPEGFLSNIEFLPNITTDTKAALETMSAAMQHTSLAGTESTASGNCASPEVWKQNINADTKLVMQTLSAVVQGDSVTEDIKYPRGQIPQYVHIDEFGFTKPSTDVVSEVSNSDTKPCSTE